MTQLVYDLLTKHNLSFQPHGSDYNIKCLNPNHNDTNPSLKVDKTTGMMHCFSCGFKGNIFSFYGVRNNFVSIKVQLLKDKLRRLAMSGEDLPFITETSPFRRNFRGISGKTYETFGAFTAETQQENLTDRVYFPIKNILNKTIAYIGRCTRGNDSFRQSKYYIYPSKTPLSIYPCVFPKHTDSLVLVEGIFDVINLHDKGLTNSACIFGVDNLTNNIATHLQPIKAQNISKIILVMDPDIAGEQAALKLRPLIEAEGFECRIVKLDKNTDPGDLSLLEVKHLKDRINENSNY